MDKLRKEVFEYLMHRHLPSDLYEGETAINFLVQLTNQSFGDWSILEYVVRCYLIGNAKLSKICTLKSLQRQMRNYVGAFQLRNMRWYVDHEYLWPMQRHSHPRCDCQYRNQLSLTTEPCPFSTLQQKKRFRLARDALFKLGIHGFGWDKTTVLELSTFAIYEGFSKNILGNDDPFSSDFTPNHVDHAEDSGASLDFISAAALHEGETVRRARLERMRGVEPTGLIMAPPNRYVPPPRTPGTIRILNFCPDGGVRGGVPRTMKNYFRAMETMKGRNKIRCLIAGDTLTRSVRHALSRCMYNFVRLLGRVSPVLVLRVLSSAPSLSARTPNEVFGRNFNNWDRRYMTTPEKGAKFAALIKDAFGYKIRDSKQKPQSANVNYREVSSRSRVNSYRIERLVRHPTRGYEISLAKAKCKEFCFELDDIIREKLGYRARIDGVGWDFNTDQPLMGHVFDLVTYNIWKW